MNALLIFIAVLIGLVILWAMLKKQKPERRVSFVCAECGERDCICHRTD